MGFIKKIGGYQKGRKARQLACRVSEEEMLILESKAKRMGLSNYELTCKIVKEFLKI